VVSVRCQCQFQAVPFAKIWNRGSAADFGILEHEDDDDLSAEAVAKVEHEDKLFNFVEYCPE